MSEQQGTHGLLQESDRLKLNPATIVREEEPGKWLVYLPATRTLHFIKTMGKEIVDLCDGDKTVREVVESFLAQYNASADEIKEEVFRFLSEMTDRGLMIHRKGV